MRSRCHFVLTLLRGRIHHTLLVAEGRSLRFWKGQMGQILFGDAMGTGILYLLYHSDDFDVFLSIWVSRWFRDFDCFRDPEILRSWPLSAHFLLLPVLAGPTIHRRWIHIYIHTYILYLLDWSLQFIPLGFGLISKLMDIISLDPRNAQLPRCRAARWRNITFLRISSCSSWCKPLRNDETRSII